MIFVVCTVHAILSRWKSVNTFKVKQKKLNVWDKLKQDPASNFKPQVTTSDYTIIQSQPVVTARETRTDWPLLKPTITPSKNKQKEHIHHIYDDTGDLFVLKDCNVIYIYIYTHTHIHIYIYIVWLPFLTDFRICIRAVRLIEIEIKSWFELARFLNRFKARFFLITSEKSFKSVVLMEKYTFSVIEFFYENVPSGFKTRHVFKLRF